MPAGANKRLRDAVRIVTIGVYGFTADLFRQALIEADIDVFVDTRRRRGVRGHDYVFANSQRLQALLAELGIPYAHRPDLAPSREAIRAQDQADRDARIRRRDRERLSDTMIETYRRDVLDSLDSHELVDSLGNPAWILLFCVERTPEACHRSLLAGKLAQDIGTDVTHIVP